MGVYGTHLVDVSLGDTLDHVLDVRADGADGGQFLADSEPFADAEGALVLLEDLETQMTEGTAQLSARTLNLDKAVVDGEGNSFGELNNVAALDQLHSLPEKQNKNKIIILKAKIGSK